MTDYKKELVKLIDRIAHMHTPRDVFKDFIEMVACSISNSVDHVHFDEREKRYLEIIHKYDSTRQQLFPEALAMLTMALEVEALAGTPSDVLGPLFMEMKINDKGQFFTPQHMCTMMGKMTLFEHDTTIAKNGHITLYEPCCGAGAMVLGFAQAMKDCKYDYTRQVVVTAVDIDIKCVHMCYIQLALYGIPAVVIHGDTITVKEWSHWYTPTYMLGGWPMKLRHTTAEITTPESSAGETSGEQLSLFNISKEEEKPNGTCKTS